jgi:hypothetical protein
MMGTELVKSATLAIESALKTCNVAALREQTPMAQAVILATGMGALRRAMSDELVKEVFMPLQGTALGFITDKDRDGGYPVSVVRDCLIEAMVMGLRPIGNEINIISGRAYAAKSGVARLVQEFPGVSDLVITPGVAQMVGDKGALVPMRASWYFHGEPKVLIRDVEKAPDGTMRDTRVMVRVNSGMGADAIIGKATRKVLKAILDQLTGSVMQIADGETVDTIGEVVTEPTAPLAPPEQDGQRIKLGRNREQPKPAEPDTREPGQEG